MACHQFGYGSFRGVICCPNIYKYPHNGKEYYFEWHDYFGPTAVKKNDLCPRSTVPTGFWDAVTEFDNLSNEQRKQYLISD